MEQFVITPRKDWKWGVISQSVWFRDILQIGYEREKKSKLKFSNL